ncbi:MAG: glycerate kinase [Clostridia bacterium]|nr:glycerate kinase [Clostridia bacterium]
MEVLKFGLGLRFDLLEQDLYPGAEQLLWEEVFSVLTASDVHNLHVYGGLAGEPGRAIYNCIFTNGKLSQMRRIYRKLAQDAGIGMYLSSQRPFIQTNVIRNLPDLPFFGKVQRSGVLEGGTGLLPGGVLIPQKHGKRRPVGKGIKVLLAPGALSEEVQSLDSIKILTLAARKHFPGVKVIPVPLPNGGRGVVESAVMAADGVFRKATVTDASGARTTATYGVLYGKTAVLELAAVCNPSDSPLTASSYGAGELIRRALDEGLREILISADDCAFTDGGMGLARALGVKFYDEEENELKGSGAEMRLIRRIDTELMHPRLGNTHFRIMSCYGNNFTKTLRDMRETLPKEDILLIKEGVKNFRAVAKEYLGEHAVLSEEHVPGGLGPMLSALLKPECISGIEAYLDAVDFDGLLKGVALAVTADGWLGESEERRERVAPAILKRCHARRVPVTMMTGRMDDEIRSFYKQKSVGVMPVIDSPMTAEDAREALPHCLVDAANRMFHFIRIGRDVEKIGAPKRQK